MAYLNFVYYLIITYIIGLPIRVFIGIPLMLLCAFITFIFLSVFGEDGDDLYSKVSTYSMGWSCFYLRYRFCYNMDQKKSYYNVARMVLNNESFPQKVKDSAQRVMDHYNKNYRNA